MRKLGLMSVLLMAGGLYSTQASAWWWSNQDWQVSDGWRNGGSEFDCTWRAANVWMESGTAILHAKSDKGNKSCAELRTYNYTRKGRYEVQMQAGSVPGTISSFFTYTGDAGTSSHYEVDIELMGAPTCSIPTSGSRGASIPRTSTWASTVCPSGTWSATPSTSTRRVLPGRSSAAPRTNG